MSLFVRIPALLVALGLLVSGGQAKVCEFTALVGIDLHAPAAHCEHSGGNHKHSEPAPCTDECLVELNEGVAPSQESVPSLSVAEGFESSFRVDSVFLSGGGSSASVVPAWHVPPQVRLPSLHSDPLFSGRFLV